MLRVFLALSLGCGGPPAPSASRTDPGLFDAPDRCPLFERACYDGFDFEDTDGCPDPPPVWIAFEPRSVAVDASAERWLGELARTASWLRPGVRVRVVGYALPQELDGTARLRAHRAVEWLTTHGVDPAILVEAEEGPVDSDGPDDPAARCGIAIEAGGC